MKTLQLNIQNHGEQVTKLLGNLRFYFQFIHNYFFAVVRCLPCDLDMYKYTLLRLTSSHDDNFYDSTTLTVVDKRGIIHGKYRK